MRKFVAHPDRCCCYIKSMLSATDVAGSSMCYLSKLFYEQIDKNPDLSSQVCARRPNHEDPNIRQAKMGHNRGHGVGGHIRFGYHISKCADPYPRCYSLRNCDGAVQPACHSKVRGSLV